MNSENIKLTEFSHGAGCGCKISPGVLETILNTSSIPLADPRLLVGNLSKDDAAVYDLGDGTAIISTTDFFMPIVDDPFTFGGIASVNAISDIYAMGGKPIMAIAILGWPIDKIPAQVANQVLEGSRAACREAGISVAGGHSIDSPEPIFGLAVTGIVPTDRIKKNNQARPDSLLYLTKPLGVGILSTAQKRGVIEGDHLDIAIRSMLTLNKIGASISELEYVSAMTDVTGFGLLGHLIEICEGSNLSGQIDFGKVPVIPEALPYLEQGCIPGGSHRNWDSYGHKVGELSERQRLILTDPQTSGGLLVAIDPDMQEDFEHFMKARDVEVSEPLGTLSVQGPKLITVE